MLLALKMEEDSKEPRNGSSLGSGKGKEPDSSLQSSGVDPSCPNLDFSLMRPILYFDVQNYNTFALIH